MKEIFINIFLSIYSTYEKFQMIRLSFVTIIYVNFKQVGWEVFALLFETDRLCIYITTKPGEQNEVLCIYITTKTFKNTHFLLISSAKIKGKLALVVTKIL